VDPEVVDLALEPGGEQADAVPGFSSPSTTRKYTSVPR
jgi:hypothetical protein